MDRRDFLVDSSALLSGASLMGLGSTASLLKNNDANKKGPFDYIIVKGHYDIWEFNSRFKLSSKAHPSPLRDHILPRFLKAGIDVVIIQASGDRVAHRMGSDKPLSGTMRTIDMLIEEIGKTDKASLIKTKKDIPDAPDPDHVKFLFSFEGGESIQNIAEPVFHPDRKMAKLRNFFRLGLRALLLTHNSCNRLGDGAFVGVPKNKLPKFGVEVIREMNRLGMMLDVSHLNEAGVIQAAKISSKPIVSTHQNPRHFIDTPLQLSDRMIKAIASTGGIVGVRYQSEKLTPYKRLVDMIIYIANLVGIEHTGIAWLGNDVGMPILNYKQNGTAHNTTAILKDWKERFGVGFIEGKPRGIAALTKYEHNKRFIELLEKSFSEDEIALIMGENYLRIWKEILPSQ